MSTKSKKLFIPMTKFDAEKGIAYGVAASSMLDRSNEIFDYATSKPHFEKWSADAHKATAGKSLGNLRSMHGQIAAGKLESINFNDEDELIEIAAKVVDPAERAKCEEGVYTGFSMGGAYAKKWKDGTATRYTAVPYEISLVDLPCIPDATFEYTKGAQSEMRKFHTVEAEPAAPTNDEIAEKARELAKAAGNEDEWAKHISDATEALQKGADVDIETFQPKNVAAIATVAADDPVAKAAGDGDENWQQVWTHPDLPGQTFEKKADLRAALVRKQADDKIAELGGPAASAIEQINEVLDARDPEGAAARKAAKADPDKAKANPDKKVPPKDAEMADAKEKAKAKQEADKGKPMKSAVDVIARAKLECAKAVPSFVARRDILKAAGEFDAFAGLPDGFVDESEPLAKSASPDLQKAATLYSVSNLIGMVSQLEAFHSGLINGGGGYYYGDGNSITQVDVEPELLTAIGDMCDQLGEKAAMLLDQILSAMKSDDAAKALGRGNALGGLFKVGARNSAADKNRLTKAHDLLSEIDPEMCAASKHAGVDMAKSLIAAQDDSFKKFINESLMPSIADIAKRVQSIESQPVGGRPSSVNVITKSADAEVLIKNASDHDRQDVTEAEAIVRSTMISLEGRSHR